MRAHICSFSQAKCLQLHPVFLIPVMLRNDTFCLVLTDPFNNNFHFSNFHFFGPPKLSVS